MFLLKWLVCSFVRTFIAPTQRAITLQRVFSKYQNLMSKRLKMYIDNDAKLLMLLSMIIHQYKHANPRLYHTVSSTKLLTFKISTFGLLTVTLKGDKDENKI